MKNHLFHKIFKFYHLIIISYDENCFGIHQESITSFISPCGIDESRLESRAWIHKSCKLTGIERQNFTLNLVWHAVEQTIG